MLVGRNLSRGGAEGEDALLAACYRKSLGLAAVHQIRSIAFPAISCGAFGFPQERAARIAVAQVREFTYAADMPYKVVFCCFKPDMLMTYNKLLEMEP